MVQDMLLFVITNKSKWNRRSRLLRDDLNVYNDGCEDEIWMRIMMDQNHGIYSPAVAVAVCTNKNDPNNNKETSASLRLKLTLHHCGCECIVGVGLDGEGCGLWCVGEEEECGYDYLHRDNWIF